MKKNGAEQTLPTLGLTNNQLFFLGFAQVSSLGAKAGVLHRGQYKSSRAKGRFPSNGTFLNQRTAFGTFPYTKARCREGQKSTWRSSWLPEISGSFCCCHGGANGAASGPHGDPRFPFSTPPQGLVLRPHT